MFSASFLYSGAAGSGGAHCASLAAGNDGELLAAWYVYPQEETRDARLVIARRSSGTGQWSEGTPLPMGLNSSLGNPVLFRSPNDGTIWLHFVALRGRYWDSAVWHASASRDHGRTFDPPRPVVGEEGLMIRHAPVLTDDGRALIPVYSDRTKESFIYESMAPYDTWRRAHRFGAFPVIQASLVRDGAGRLIAFFRPAAGPRCCWRSISNDGGGTWSDPVRMTLPNPMSGLAACVAWKRVLLFYNHTHEHQRHPLSVSWSTGPLNDWSAPRHLDVAEFEVSYPSAYVDEDGAVHVVYTYNRRFVKHVQFDAEWLDGDDA